jgi:hypothetical protein
VSRRTAALLAWGSWAFDVAVVAFVLVVSDTADGGDGAAGRVAAVFFILAFATTGAVVASRQRSNPLGWLMCGCAVAFALGGATVAWGGLEAQGREVPNVALAAWVGTFVWILGIGPAATFLLLLFPTGRLPSPRWRAVAWLAGAAIVLSVVGLTLDSGPIEDTTLQNPVGLAGAEGVLSFFRAAGTATLLLAAAASIASLAVRFRRAAGEERQQIKWIAYAAPLVIGGVALSFAIESTSTSDAAIDAANAAVSASLALVPVAIAVAVLRHRLFDIDIVISRTLVYGGLTATLVGVYLGCVLLLGLALSPLAARSDLAIAGSTLAVAALFRPARRRIQALVDRRFNRRRYDAARTLDRFGKRLRDEVDLDALGTDLRGVVRETVQPAHVSLWLRTPGSGR